MITEKQKSQVFQEFQESPPYDYKLEGHCSQIIYIKISNDEKQIYSICKMGEFRQWDIENKEIVTKIRLKQNQESGFNTCLQIENNEGINLFQNNQSNDKATVKENGASQFFRVESKKVFTQQQGPDLIKEQSEINDLQAAIIINDQIFGGYISGVIISWDLQEGFIRNIYDQNKNQINTLNHYTYKNVEGVQFDQLVTGSEDFSIKFIDIKENKLEKGYKLSGPVQKVQIDDSNKTLYGLSNDYDIFIINLKKDEVINKINFEGVVNNFFVTDYYFVVNQFGDNLCDSELQFYKKDELPEQLTEEQLENEQELETPIFQAQFKFKIGKVNAIQVIDQYLLVGLDDGSIQFYEIQIDEKQQQIKYVDQIQYHNDGVNKIEFLNKSDRIYIVSGGEDHNILITDFQKTLTVFSERKQMQAEHFWSQKYQAYHEVLYKKKKGKGKKKK